MSGGMVLETYNEKGNVIYSKNKECTECKKQVDESLIKFEGSIYDVKIDLSICDDCNKEKSLSRRVDEVVKDGL